MAKTKVLGVRLTEEEYEAFRKASESKYDTMSRLVRVFIMNEIKKYKEQGG